MEIAGLFSGFHILLVRKITDASPDSREGALDFPVGLGVGKVTLQKSRQEGR